MERRKGSPEDRKQIRQKHKELRAAMSGAAVREKSRCICEKIVQTEWYQDCQVLYGYYPLENEVDCRMILEKALSDGKRVALPRMQSFATGEDCRMDFYEITSLEQVSEGGFHVMEPIETCPKVREERAAVLVPGVVFDSLGNRYGYGKGYYDRYFSRFPETFRVALAYENQMETKLWVSDTDVKMHRIYTEQSVYECHR